MKVLISAYACEPGSGSEPGAGYAIVRAAAENAECWVLTRPNRVDALRQDLDRHPTRFPVHLVSVDAHPAVLRLKARFGSVRAYYVIWQRLVRRIAQELDAQIDFDVIHHATLSAFWLPVGVMAVPKPLVVGPVGGGTLTPRQLLGSLGPKGIAFDAFRCVVTRLGGLIASPRWRKSVAVIVAQNEQMRRYAEKWLAGADTTLVVLSNASNPPVLRCSDVGERTPEILFVGRLLRWKGVGLALEAFARAGVPDARMVFIGEGEAEARLRRMAHQLGLAPSVEFTGSIPREEVLRRMCSASALLFPSLHDSAGFAVSEALSLGLPVVCLDHGGPGYLTTLWPKTPSIAVEVGARETVLENLAAAVRDFLVEPASLLEVPRGANIDFSVVLQQAYRVATLGEAR